MAGSVRASACGRPGRRTARKPRARARCAGQRLAAFLRAPCARPSSTSRPAVCPASLCGPASGCLAGCPPRSVPRTIPPPAASVPPRRPPPSPGDCARARRTETPVCFRPLVVWLPFGRVRPAAPPNPTPTQPDRIPLSLPSPLPFVPACCLPVAHLSIPTCAPTTDRPIRLRPARPGSLRFVVPPLVAALLGGPFPLFASHLLLDRGRHRRARTATTICRTRLVRVLMAGAAGLPRRMP